MSIPAKDNKIDEIKVPNWNSFSTLLDRLSIEVVKKAIFEDKYTKLQDVGTLLSIEEQEKMIMELGKEAIIFLANAWDTGKYECLGEQRTFK